MKAFLLFLFLLLFVGCVEPKFNSGDVVVISERVKDHPDYTKDMFKFIGKRVTLTHARVFRGVCYYSIAGDGGTNAWYEVFLTRVKKGTITLKKEMLTQHKNKSVEKIVQDSMRIEKTDSQKVVISKSSTQENNSKRITYYKFPASKVWWFWKLYEKAVESGGHSDWFEVWEYIYKYIPEVERNSKVYSYEIDDRGASPKIWKIKGDL